MIQIFTRFFQGRCALNMGRIMEKNIPTHYSVENGIVAGGSSTQAWVYVYVIKFIHYFYCRINSRARR